MRLQIYTCRSGHSADVSGDREHRRRGSISGLTKATMPRLEVKVGPDRWHMEPCRLNDTLHPHEIDTEHFAGRVLVRILDAPGAREGEPGREYFTDRSRKFCIQIEGRFKQEWSGEDILFGSDFDKLVPFPRAPFNAGMRVAQMIDPCTFYEEHPPSQRPYIMSPYVACMNVFCAWPAPSRAHDAVVVYRHTHSDRHGSHSRSDSRDSQHHTGLVDESDLVPLERLEHVETDQAEMPKKSGFFSSLTRSNSTKDERVTPDYWRFIGFRTDDRVRAYAQSHGLTLRSNSNIHATAETSSVPRVSSPLVRGTSTAGPTAGSAVGSSIGSGGSSPVLAPVPERPPVESSILASPTSETLPQHTSHNSPTLKKPLRMLQGLDRKTFTSLGTSKKADGPMVPRKHADRPGTPNVPLPSPQDALEHARALAASAPPAPTTAHRATHEPVPPPSVPAMVAPTPRHGVPDAVNRHTKPPLSPLATRALSAGPEDEESRLAQLLQRISMTPSPAPVESKLDHELGPWRFSDPGTDMVEDNAFIFIDESVSVPQRRRHFANTRHRFDFKYDPDIVYGASFFSNLMDFNTFNLSIGPVRINLTPFFREMPIRYTLRARGNEDLTFATISFQLVDD